MGVAFALTSIFTGPVRAQEPTRCASADALRLVDEKESARKAYVALLKRDPTVKCARTGLKTINVPPPDKKAQEVRDSCALGGAYLTLHRRDDALTAYKSALGKDPNAACARGGIRKSGPGAVRRTLDMLAEEIPRALFVFGLLLVLLFLVLLLGYIGPVHGWLVQRRLFGRILSPRLNVEPLTDESDLRVGTSIEARIRERLTRMREEAGRADAPSYELEFGTPREDFAELVAGDGGLKSALDKASEASEHTKIVAALLHLLYALLPIRRLTIAGVVEPPVGPTASATLSLEKDGSLAAATTLRGPDPPPARTPPATGPDASDYMKLSEPAAVWVQYEVARAIQDGEHLGPDAAESYALVREGLDRQLAGDHPEAREFYERALDLDHFNWAALVNLATTEARLGQNYEGAVDILADGFDRIQQL